MSRESPPPVADDATRAKALIQAAREVDYRPDLEQQREQLEQLRQRPKTLRDRVRELPSWLRLGIGVLGVALVSVLMFFLEGGLGAKRLEEAERARLMWTSVVASVGAGVALAITLRGAWRPAKPRRWIILLLLGLGPPAAGLLPLAIPLPADAVTGGWRENLMCGAASLVLAGVVTGWALWLERGGRPTPDRRLAAVAAGGLAGWIVQSWHCMIGGPAHLILGHGAAGILLGIVLFAWPTRPRASTGPLDL